MANKGLGRGLGSLLGILDDSEEEVIKKEEPKKEVVKEIDGEEVKNIEIGMIDVNPNQPRKIFDPTALNELAQSIKIHGVIQPILLTPRNGRFMIVAGERRFRASIIAQIKTLPAIIKEFDDKEVKEIALLENIQRQDLNPIETARALKELQDTYGWTQESLADRLGKSRPVIANTLRLLTLCPEVIDLIEKGKLSAGHARSLVVVTNPEVQLKLANQVINNKLTVRDMENAVRSVDNTARKVIKTPKPQLSMEMQEFIDVMEH
jgi:ParB family chromosome partitioning protein